MDFFIHAVSLSLFLNCAAAQFYWNRMSPHSSECSREHNATECVYYVECTGSISEGLDSYVVRPRNPYMNRFETYDCVGYIQHGPAVFNRIYLKYKENQPVTAGATIPETRSENRGYGTGPPMCLLIVRLDISENEYTVVPNLKEMKNLAFLNLSTNYLTVARLSNPEELPALTEIDLSHNTIASIEADPSQYLYSNLKKLNMSHNYMVGLTDSVFEKFILLEVLDLSYNFIDTLSIAAFEGIKKLTKLFISHNRITDINRSFFRFTELRVLDLSYNRMENVKINDFEKLTKLESIDLSFNSIISIDQCTFCSLNFLVSINLHNNSLSSINKETFPNTSSLESVDISYNNFNMIPRGLFLGKNIRNFAVDGNHLKGALASGMFEGLRLVTELDLSHQQLTSLEDNAFLGLDNLATLLLNNNKISIMTSNSFNHLLNLRTLDLSSNNITELSFCLKDLLNLNVILLKNNFLTQLRHDYFHGLSFLQFLDLSSNNITKFETDSFDSLQRLVNLQISKNPLSGTLQEKTFNGLKSLPSLVLSFTQLTVIENGSFYGLSQLKQLNMSHSKINELQYNAFSETGAIEIIDLSNNQLRTFDVNASDLSSISVLVLDKNLLKSIGEFTFFGLSRLTKISLAHNNIKAIHTDALKDQNDLEYLDISYNLEMKFDVSIILHNKNLDNLCLSGIRSNITFRSLIGAQLSDLAISYSGLTNITEVRLKELPRLQNVILSNNDISKLEVGAFTNVTQLRTLDISNNKIYFIQPGVFKDSIQLSFINISHNSITTISYGIFRGLVYLTKLDISYNNLNSLESERFFELQSLRTLIVDHNEISSFKVEDFGGTNLETLSIGENPLPCEFLVNMKRNPMRFIITAIKLNEHVNENVDGVTCNMNGYQFKNQSNKPYSDDSIKFLADIRDLLLKIFNKSTENQRSIYEKDENFQNIRNLTDRIDKITDKYENHWSSLSNSSFLLAVQSNNTNLLLNKILNAINRRPLGVTAAVPVPTSNSTKDLILYINNIKDDLENTIAVEKQNILNEIEKKLASNIEVSSTDSPKIAIQDKLLAKNEPVEHDKSNVFTETCVALILCILVCYILYKFYKSRMFVRASRSYSTRELPGAMESPDL